MRNYCFSGRSAEKVTIHGFFKVLHYLYFLHIFGIIYFSSFFPALGAFFCSKQWYFY